MSTLKRTILFDTHVAANATMVDFGGWEMPIQYPTGIVEEHLYTRRCCSLFDVSHMGRFLIEGAGRKAFLQHVLTSNVDALEVGQAQYCIIPDADGNAIDDAYLYRFEAENFILVVNASNTEKDWAHLTKEIAAFDAAMTDLTAAVALIAVQGPEAKAMLMRLSGGKPATEPVKNALGEIAIDGVPVRVAKTGYTGEPIGYELFMDAKDAKHIWDRLIECGARPAGLGARDTLRIEAGLPLYGHEMGEDANGKPFPIFAVPLARFAVSFAEGKGDYIGRRALEAQFAAHKRILNRDFSDIAALPRRIRPIVLTGRGVMRAGFPVFQNGRKIGYVTSGTMVPYYKTDGKGLMSVITADKALRSIGLCYADSTVTDYDAVQVEIRGGLTDAAIVPYHLRADAPPYARPIVFGQPEEQDTAADGAYADRAEKLLHKALDNHIWRQSACINLIPSEQTASRAVRLLSASDPSFRYAEHKKAKSFYDADVFYYQGTKFIDRVEQLLVDEMRRYLGCAEVETRIVSGQMSNTAVFSAIMDFKNRVDRKRDPKRLGYVLNNHIIRGGHLSAQPMGALHDYIAIDPVTERAAVVNFPVLPDNPYKIDVAETAKLIERYRPELIIFGKSMVLHREPVAEIRKIVDELGVQTTIMYDMAHILGLVGDHFQNPFQEGAEIVTGSTHKTFFGPQRGVIGVNYQKEDLKYGLWEAIEARAFPGSVSNHHLGTQLGLLMAAYEMNAFKDAYQSAVVHNAKDLAQCLVRAGLDVAGDKDISYTETHQVIVNVGYGQSAAVAERLEENGIIVNYQATPDEEGFTASGALRLGVQEMTRFGFDHAAWETLAELMADVILRGKDVRAEITQLRSRYLTLGYCFDDARMHALLNETANRIGL